MITPLKNLRLVLLLILTCCAVLQIDFRAHGQTDRPQVSVTHTPDPVPVLSDEAKRQLRNKLESAATTSLQIVNVDGAPLEVDGPQATSIKIEGNYDPPADPGAMINDYVTRLRFRLINRTGRLVTGAGLEFTNAQNNNTFFVYHSKIEIEPGKSKKFEIPFMAVTGDPAYLSIQLAGIEFGDSSTWGGFPFPPPRRSVAQASSATAPASSLPISPPTLPVPTGSGVDSKPRLLNSPRPRYTEDARKNHVMGTVVAQLLVGSDGAVKRVDVKNALPDGLTEQAILSAYQLKFEPAKKNGEPVAYWMPVQVDFNLK